MESGRKICFIDGLSFNRICPCTTELRSFSTNELSRASKITGDWSSATVVVVTRISRQSSAVSRQPSATSRQPSATSRQPSAISHQPSAVSRQLSATSRQSPAVSHQPSAVSRQPSVVSRQPPVDDEICSRRPTRYDQCKVPRCL